MSIRVAVFTDEPVTIEGLKAIFRSVTGFELVPLTCEPKLLSSRLQKSSANILLFDASTHFSFYLLAQVVAAVPGCHVLLWTQELPIQVVHQAMELGVKGIVRKNLSIELTLRCFTAVAHGELWFERALTQRLFEAKAVKLTKRESQLMMLVGQGLSNREIGEILFLSEGTVKFYLSRLFRKMQVGDRFELALYGLKMMMGRPAERDLARMHVPRSIVLEHQGDSQNRVA